MTDFLQSDSEQTQMENLRSQHCRILPTAGIFRDLEVVYLLENKWSRREDLNLRPPWSRTRCERLLKSLEFCYCQLIDIEPVAGRSLKAVAIY
jgi:hypothetical protein